MAILVQNFLSTFLQNKKGLFCFSCFVALQRYFRPGHPPPSLQHPRLQGQGAVG